MISEKQIQLALIWSQQVAQSRQENPRTGQYSGRTPKFFRISWKKQVSPESSRRTQGKAVEKELASFSEDLNQVISIYVKKYVAMMLQDEAERSNELTTEIN